MKRLLYVISCIFLFFKTTEIRNQLKAQQQLGHGSDCADDPDSRMDTDRDRRDQKKAAKGRGIRGSAKGSFWQK